MPMPGMVWLSKCPLTIKTATLLCFPFSSTTSLSGYLGFKKYNPLVFRTSYFSRLYSCSMQSDRLENVTLFDIETGGRATHCPTLWKLSLK